MGETVLVGLAEWAIRATALAGAVGALLWALRIKDAHVRLTAWTIVLASVLLMPVAAPVLPRLPVPMPAFLSRPNNREPLPRVSLSFPRAVNPDFNSASRRAPRWKWTDVVAGLWLLIAVGMLLRLALGLRLGARLVRSSRVIEGEIRESDLVRVPITLGVIRPAVVLPSDWREWPERELRAVIAHERGHVARRDPLRQLAASIYRSVAWFHPLAWWLRAEIAQLAEAASDDAVIAAGGDPIKYAEALLSFFERTPQRVQWEGVPMATRETRMRRIERILDQNRKLSQPPGNRMIAGLVLAALPMIYVATAIRPASAQARVLASQAVQPENKNVCGGNPAWLRWLNEDVLYIITNQERQAFEQLGSDAECTKFSEQFWFRRDPTPGTQENEFKEEHYRRIAYANEHYASQLAGWKTDRGRVYIAYGPPDEIESFPSGRSGTVANYPFEQWLYHHINSVGDDVVFEFIDQAHTDEYRLSFMGGPAERTVLEGKGDDRTVLFGPVDGLSVQANPSRTLLITAPVRRSSVAVSGMIVDHNGATVQKFEDTAQSPIYGKRILSPLPPGQYTLHISAGGDRRNITFEVK